LLQPEFVMTVGDFVGGYTSEQEEMDEQWEAFEATACCWSGVRSEFARKNSNHNQSKKIAQ
jgi:hypothetical protein